MCQVVECKILTVCEVGNFFNYAIDFTQCKVYNYAMEKLKQLRIQHNLKMKELGDRINVSESAISQYEAGKRKPDYDTLLKLADIFNVSTDYLLGRTNEKVEKELAGNLDPRFLNLLKANNISLESLNNLDEKKSQLVIDMIQNLIEKHK